MTRINMDKNLNKMQPLNDGTAWKLWKQKFSIYLTADDKEKEDEKLKIALLLNFIGDEGILIYNTFEKQDCDTLAKVLKSFDEHFLPKNNTVAESYKFYTMEQQLGEPIDNYITRLKNQMLLCEFECSCKKSYGDRLIRDRLIFGIQNESLKKKLISEKNLTMDAAIELCKVNEIVKQTVKMVSGESSIENIDYIRSANVKPTYVNKNNFNNKRSVFQYNTKCARCGKNHNQSVKCPAFGKSCNKCQRLGHFAEMCRSKNVNVLGVEGESHERNLLELPSGESSFDTNNQEELYDSSVCVGAISSDKISWYKDIMLRGIKIKFKIDTGAECNILPKSKIEGTNIVKQIYQERTTLIAYGNYKIQCNEKVKLCSEVDGKKAILEFIVIEGKLQPLLGLDGCIKLGIIKEINLVEEDVPLLPYNKCELINMYKDIFEGLGEIPGVYRIKIKDNAVPVIKYRKRVPFSLHDKLKSKLDEVVKQGIISPVDHPTEWVNNLVIVEKSNGDLRLCLDPISLNKYVEREHYMIPTVDDILVKLSGRSIFSVIDMKDGFWQIQLDKDSADLCTFSTPFGRFQFNRLPFGLNSAPEVFHRRCVEIFGSIPGVEVYFDDLIIAGKNEMDHDKILKQVFEKARKYNIKFNKNKIQLRVKEVTFLGHVISKDFVRPDNKHIIAIKEMEIPKDRKGVLRLLGVTKFVARFIPNLSDKTANLRNLTKNNVVFEWKENHKKEFDLIKEILSSQPVLKQFDPSKPCVLQADASKNGLGAVLLQEGHPVTYASRSLTPTQKGYSQLEKELLAIVFGTEKFHQYIYGNYITIQTDHKPIVTIVKQDLDKPTIRVQRMLLKLMRYNFSVHYVPGREMYIADTLSRASLPQISSDDPEMNYNINHIVDSVCISKQNKLLFINENVKDDVLCRVRFYLLNGWPKNQRNLKGNLKQYYKLRHNLTVVDEFLFLGNKMIIPKSLRIQILNELHMPHLGITKMKLKARELYYWPKMSKDIQYFVDKCKSCQEFSKSLQKEPLKSYELSSFPWERVSLDIFEYGGLNYLLLVDSYSNWIEISPLKNKSIDEVIRVLMEIFVSVGFPCKILSDNNPFCSWKFKEFAEKFNIELKFSSPYHSQSNGLAEKSVGIVKQIMRKSNGCQSLSEIKLALLEYKNSPLSTLGLSPAQLFLGRMIKTRAIVPQTKNLIPRFIDPEDVVKKKINTQKLQSHYYNRQAKLMPNLTPDETVLLRDINQRKWLTAKVVKAVNNRSYLVQNGTGNIIRRNKRFLKKTKIPHMDRSHWLESVRASKDYEDGTNTTSNNSNLLSINDSGNNNLQTINEQEEGNNDRNTSQDEDELRNRTTVSRSGRIIKLPTYLKEYDLN